MPYILAQCIAVGWPWVVPAAQAILNAVEYVTRHEIFMSVAEGWLYIY